MQRSDVASPVVVPHSSGNLIADKRFAYAEALQNDGDVAAAAELFDQVTELVPEWAPAFVALGLSSHALGRRTVALKALETAERLDPQGVFGASLYLSRLRSEDASGMSPAYVTALFDQYAPRFDAHLVGTLGYRAPSLILESLDRVVGEATFVTALDLGCGTGLMGRVMEKRVATLDGVDLSARMVALARATGLYRNLDVAECVGFLEGVPNNTYDLLLAADVFVYFGTLSAVLAQVARVTKPGGLVAFTVQSTDGTHYNLGDDLRFCHSPAYVRHSLGGAGLLAEWIEGRSSRRQAGIDVPGLVVVARAS